MKASSNIFSVALAVIVVSGLRAQTVVPVTVDNFVRAETDMTFDRLVKSSGALGKWQHFREMASLDNQVVPRVNRDTLYSSAVFDLDAGPVTITMPDAGERFMSLIVIDEEHYVHGVYYGAGSHTHSKDKIGTRYVVAALRTLVDPQNQDDMKAAHALQDAAKIEQPGGPGVFEIPNWDPASLKKVHDALLVLNETLPDLRRAGGRRGQVDPVRHLIATASAWGLNPDKDAIYLNVTPPKNDGTTVHRLTAKDVPADAFWSITVYDAEGYIQKNAQNAYSLNNITANKNADGSVTIQFGGCDGTIPNCLPIMSGWNYMVRLYRPRKEILDGTWKFPQAETVSGKGGDAMLGGPWVLVKLNGKSVAGREISLEFDTTAGRASGSTGVNRWNGSYKLSGDSIEFGPLITTRRAGPPEAMRLETAFTQALAKVTKFSQEVNRLSLAAGESVILVFERMPDESASE